MRLRRAARVILIGAPGVGKGTQSERLLRRFPQLQSISSGDLLRQNVKDRTPLGIKVESTMKAGGLVSDDLMVRLVSNELFKRGWIKGQGPPPVMTLASASAAGPDALPTSPEESIIDSILNAAGPRGDAHPPPEASECPSASFLLDGFPRTAAQAATLDRIVPINLVVSIKTPVEVIMERIASRWVHEPSGRIYNTTFNKPKVAGRDDVTGEPLIQRPDDSAEVFRARFDKFEETSRPLLEHYGARGVLWEVSGMSSDEISPELFRRFEEEFVN
ncbi:related to adenylate kinase [Cephalotrichum gorgonifer]|uniref:GTP:AMP phosphotransferase, mitochondrial n=1 Tax=Cephalotrichum gorgonifer TaxID=2041049 RepID=A0AAE8N7I2_9PEZI|nr:related to adenylate kinase [Cephalotrichum gorgonifer]